MDTGQIRLAHSTVVTPHKAGLYETTVDFVRALRSFNVDSRIIDPVNDVDKPLEDRGVPIAPRAWAEEADFICSHSGLGPLGKLDKPLIHFFHGRPYSSYLLEQMGKIAVYSFHKKIAHNPRYKAFVTFWPDFLPYFKTMFPPEKLTALTPPVNLEKWTPEGPNGYEFHGNKGEINVVIADLWREDKTPFHVIYGFMEFARQYQSAKLHIYAAPDRGTSWGVLLSLIREAGYLGELAGIIKGLDNVYRAADLLITPHRIATRTVREALACGCQVVMAPSRHKYTPYQADPEDPEAYAWAMSRAWVDKLDHNTIKRNRSSAIFHFNPNKTALDFLELLEEIAK